MDFRGAPATRRLSQSENIADPGRESLKGQGFGKAPKEAQADLGIGIVEGDKVVGHFLIRVGSKEDFEHVGTDHPRNQDFKAVLGLFVDDAFLSGNGGRLGTGQEGPRSWGAKGTVGIFPDDTGAGACEGVTKGDEMGFRDEGDEFVLAFLRDREPRAGILEPEKAGKGVVDAARSGIEIGVGGQEGDLRGGDIETEPDMGVIGTEGLKRVPNKRMVRHNHGCLGLFGRGEYVRRNGKASHDVSDGPGRVSDLKPYLVPIAGQRRRRPAFHGLANVTHANGHAASHSMDMAP